MVKYSHHNKVINRRDSRSKADSMVSLMFRFRERDLRFANQFVERQPRPDGVRPVHHQISKGNILRRKGNILRRKDSILRRKRRRSSRGGIIRHQIQIWKRTERTTLAIDSPSLMRDLDFQSIKSAVRTVDSKVAVRKVQREPNATITADQDRCRSPCRLGHK